MQNNIIIKFGSDPNHNSRIIIISINNNDNINNKSLKILILSTIWYMDSSKLMALWQLFSTILVYLLRQLIQIGYCSLFREDAVDDVLFCYAIFVFFFLFIQFCIYLDLKSLLIFKIKIVLYLLFPKCTIQPHTQNQHNCEITLAD